MGAVYLARQVQLDRNVALKILPPELAQDQEFLERFRREARASAKLNHPNIVVAYDVGVAGGYHYIAMEYIDGKDLEQGLQSQPKGRYPESEVLSIARQMAMALQAASSAGITHRDIKPANILKHSDGSYKLTDLGLASRKVDDKQVTQTGSAVGTPFYISPEQARGEQNVDVRSDIYSLGATLFHLATGRLPFPGDNSVVVMTRHLTEQVQPPEEVEPSVSKGLSRLIVKMMAKNPKDRHQTAEELFEDLEMVERGEVPLLKRARAKVKSGGPVPMPTAAKQPVKEDSGSQPLRSQAPRGRASMPGSMHPRMSRMPTGKKPLQQTGPLGAVGKLPQPARIALWLGALFILAIIVGVVISRVVLPALQTAPAPQPVVPPKPPEKTVTIEDEKSLEAKTVVPVPVPVPAPPPVQPHPAPTIVAPPLSEPPPPLTGKTLYAVDFTSGNMDNWAVDEAPPPAPLENATKCGLVKPCPGWYAVDAFNTKLKLALPSPDRTSIRFVYYLSRKESEILIQLNLGPDISRAIYRLKNPVFGKWQEQVVNISEFPIVNEERDGRKFPAPNFNRPILRFDMYTGTKKAAPGFYLRSLEFIERDH